jgi:Domain of unknown function (DUF3480)
MRTQPMLQPARRRLIWQVKRGTCVRTPVRPAYFPRWLGISLPSLALISLLAFVWNAQSAENPIVQTLGMSAAGSTNENCKFPMDIELIPKELNVRIYFHDMRGQSGFPVPCWTYVTDGLRSYRHPELVLTVVRAKDERPQDFPRDILTYFKDVHRFARAGYTVTIGGRTLLAEGSAGFFGRPDFTAIVYTAPIPIEGIDTRDHLTAIVLTSEEWSVAETCGLTRVLANLGLAYRFYPTTPWCDRTRASVISKEPVNKGSLLPKMQHMTLEGAQLCADGENILLKLPHSTAESVKLTISKISTNDPCFALCTYADPEADCCLVWKPGQKAPAAIGPTEKESVQSKRTGNYIGFVGGRTENEVKLVEDGFMFLLTNDSWNRIRKALVSATAVSVPMKNKESPNLTVKWLPSPPGNR